MSVFADAVYAVRQAVRRPGVPLVIVLSLGIAQGINTSLFSFVNAIWFRPWDVDGADQIRIVTPMVSIPTWQYWGENTRTSVGIAASLTGPLVRINGQRTGLEFVSVNYFRVLRVPIQLGRPFSSDEAGVIVSHRYWQTQLGGDPDAIGRSIELEPLAPTVKKFSVPIVGVAAASFEGPDQRRISLWLPLGAIRLFEDQKPTARTDAPTVMTFVRLSPGSSQEMARSELVTLAGRLETEHDRSASASSVPVQLRTTDQFSVSAPRVQAQATLASLLAGVVFITSIACANVSNLVMARGLTRRAELATRRALGATRGQIVRLLLIENVMFTGAAAWIAAMMALWLPAAALRTFFRHTSPDFASLLRVTFPLDWRVYLWLLVTSTIACGAFGLRPALQCADAELGGDLKSAEGASWSLLSYQTIVSVMALAIAALILQSDPTRSARQLWRAMSDLAVIRLEFRPGTAEKQMRERVDSITTRLRTMAGSDNVAGLTRPMQVGVAQTLQVTPEYFRVLGIPATAGRTFAESDAAGDVMVVNAAFARRFWPDTVALGHVLDRAVAGVWDRRLFGRHVIGVVDDAQLASPAAYLPAEQKDLRILLARIPLERLAAEFRKPRASTESEMLAAEVLSGGDWFAGISGPMLLGAYAATGFGAVALLLGAIGFFSLLEYAVRRRTREIGIRIALGARTRHIMQSLLEPASKATLRGLAFGIAGAMYVGVIMRRAEIPAGVHPFEVGSFASVTVVILAAGVAAAFRPMRRALRIEPSDALRAE